MTGKELEAVIRNSYARGFLKRGIQKKFKDENTSFSEGVLNKSEVAGYIDIMTYTYSFLDLIGMMKLSDLQRDCIERRYYSKEGKKYIDSINLTLSTIHAYKGSEVDNVIYIANITKKIFERSTKQQEGIISYVAMTRAKKKLYILDMVDLERNMIFFPTIERKIVPKKDDGAK
jgi:superfamily I DNA/RNA helicase